MDETPIGEIMLGFGSILKIHPQSEQPSGVTGTSLVPGTRKFSITGEGLCNGEKSFECWASSVEEEKKWFEILSVIMEDSASRRLTVEILSGKELNAENTYCSVFPIKEDKITEIRDETQKTRIVTESGSDPVWNTAFIFRSNIPEKGYVVFRVKSKKGVQTMHLGEALLPFDFSKPNQGRVESWLQLQACKGTRSVDRFGSVRISGSIRVSLTLSHPKVLPTPNDRGPPGGFLIRAITEDEEMHL